jgi:hypothetical protein
LIMTTLEFGRGTLKSEYCPYVMIDWNANREERIWLVVLHDNNCRRLPGRQARVKSEV